MDPLRVRRYNRPMRLVPPLSILPMLFCVACGYHVRGSVTNLPAGIQSLGIPPFKDVSRQPQYKLEQRLTAAVLKEFSTRTRMPVRAASSDVEAILRGEIQNIGATPVTFSPASFGSAFLVTVQMSVKLVRVKDSAVLWQNPSFTYRERYVLNSKVTDFFSEEDAALDRLARDFAASLASTVLNH